ncbi:ROK family protein [Niabella ginsengisoli]|uniref:ROK family protein n=1 Tax=Niabella ginsengisoli TaxID=522298 RepID=A0ABS9SKP6_9BACT|nr:ROK family protein [Niabella ginsengisoli]MCH5598957.1 ROK family protein [Niabella ginsengisoli]
MTTKQKANHLIAAADIGGTHITAAVIDIVDRSIIPGSLVRLSVDASDNAENVISRWSLALKQASGDLPVSKIGIAMPGPFDYANGISYMINQGKYESLYGLNVKQLLADHLTIEEDLFSFSNDAACFLSGELFAANMDSNVFDKSISITLGTGLGTALYKNGVAASADLWSLPFKDNIAEYYLSSKWFVDQYLQRTGSHHQGVKDLVQMANSNKVAAHLFQIFSYNLADFLIQFIKREEAETIILGGNISKAYKLFLPGVKRFVADVFPHVQIKVSRLGEVACLYGAAAEAIALKVEAQ